MTDFNTVEPKGPTYWAWQFDGTQASVDDFNTRTGDQFGQQMSYVSPTEAKFGMVGVPVTPDVTTFVAQIDPAGNATISYYNTLAEAEQYYTIAP